MKATVPFIAFLLWCNVASVWSQTDGDTSPVITRVELQNYSRLQQKLYPKKGDVYSKIVEMFGERETYTANQVTAATDPKVKTPFNYDQRRNSTRAGAPLDSFTEAQAKEQLASFEKLHSKSTNLIDALIFKYGEKNWYRADELRDVEENGREAKKIDGERRPDDPVEKYVLEAERKPKGLFGDFRIPRIRESWRDVLYDEDRSQQGNETKVLKDLVGATLSYAHDGKAKTDTWTANGAIIFPWEHDFPLTGGLIPARLAIAPSASINRLDTSGDPKKEADSVVFRLGIYGDWLFPTTRPSGVQMRASPVYVTDTGWRGKLLGYEVDLEPRWQSVVCPLGYKKVLIRKEPLLEDETDKSYLDCQLRCWLHTEGGDVQDNGKSWDTTRGHFLRLGPTLQLQVSAPRLAWGKDFSVTTRYSYLQPISGSNAHRSLLKVSGVLDLIKDDQTGRKVALTAEYQVGGLNFTKEDVDVLTVGLGFLF